MFPVNIPNVLTLLRILAVPVLVVALLEETPDGDVIAAAVFALFASLFPDDPPRFLDRTPFGHHDTAVLTRELREAGFARVEVASLVKRHGRVSARDAASGKVLAAGEITRVVVDAERFMSRL